MKHLIRILLALSFLCAAAQASAQTFPDRPVTLVVGFAPGGNADIVARLVGQKMSEALRQPVIIENKGGAGGLLASEAVAKSPADGYRLLLVSGAFPAQAAVLPKLSFDPQNDFSWVGTIVSYPLVVVVPAASPFRSIDDLIRAARANPGKLNYPSPGNGSLFHLATEVFGAEAKVDMTHVPFRGGAQQLTELLAGRLDVMFDTYSVVQPSLAAGRLRAIGVTSPERLASMPDVPTVAQSLPRYEASSFLGIAGPAGLPAATVQTLNAALRSALSDAGVRQRLVELGGTPWPGSPSDMASHIRDSTARWKSIATARQIKAD
ncbi:MAG: tripartite tricarboxylate transporter substrate binding protein [Burkholderiales bacterium]|nr:tripartite tricarboxylate transporter substrate binding protein [Burkholderiales bacterium]